MNQTYLKYGACTLLFALWALLDYLFKQSPEDLISSIKWALGALGAYHTITNLQAPQQTGVPAELVMQMLQQATQPQQSKPPLPTIPLKEGS